MKKRWGDRRDGARLRDIDAMHYIMPMIMPDRTDNEAFMRLRIDLTRAEEYLARKNQDDPAYRYNLFQLIVTAILKTLTLRPLMNRFIKDNHMYQRNELTAAFIVKKIFSDHGDEAMARVDAKGRDNIDTIHNAIYRQVSFSRSDKKDASSEGMDAIKKLGFKRTLGRFFRFLDRKGWLPAGLIATDPYHCSVVLTNLGSLKVDAGYHHLSNWGTNSVFCAVGLMKKRPFFDEEGNMDMRMSVDLGVTLDERIADGYYFAKTMRLLKTLLENPELLERPLDEEVEY